MASHAASEAAWYDGIAIEELARRLRVPRVTAYAEVGSTMDVAHVLAAHDAPAGTIVLAERQTAGRGRNGRTWMADAAAGVWLTIIERPADPAVVEILSLRLGLHLAAALDAFVASPVRVKWPNDLYLAGDGPAGGKVGGVLCEARWHGDRVAWIAIGVGINVTLPTGVAGATALPEPVTRLGVLEAIVPAIRHGAAVSGGLAPEERAQLAARAFEPVGTFV